MLGTVQIHPLAVRQVGDSRTRFRGEFRVARDGELFLFVNDAMLPFTNPRLGGYDHRYFYQASGATDAKAGGNHGTACVTVEAADAAKAPSGMVPAGCTPSPQLTARRSAP